MSTATTPGSASTQADHSGRALRADAQRNRDALLEAATAAFTEHGTDASLEDIAKRAGVGIGTLYRHFPTRDALVEAAYRHGVEGLCDQADTLAAAHPPADALEQWMLAFVGYVATKRGLATSLKLASDKNADLFAYVHGRINTALGGLIQTAEDAGEIRSGVGPQDMLRALSGLCMTSDQPGWQDQARRLISLLMDGLRYGAPGPA